MKYLILLAFVAISFFAHAQQQIDTVTVYGNTKMRVIVSGDTIMMSVRQFEALRSIVHSFEFSDSISKEQIAQLKAIVAIDERIEDKWKDIDAAQERQIDMYRREYNTMYEIAGNQNQKLMEISNQMFKKDGKATWMGIGIGAGIGVVIGSFFVAILKK